MGCVHNSDEVVWNSAEFVQVLIPHDHLKCSKWSCDSRVAAGSCGGRMVVEWGSSGSIVLF